MSARESRRGGRQITALSVPPSSKKSLGGLFYFLMAKINITYRESECGAVCTQLIDSTLNILGKNHGGAEARTLQGTMIATPPPPPRIPVITILTPARPKPQGVGEPKELDRKAKLVADSSPARPVLRRDLAKRRLHLNKKWSRERPSRRIQHLKQTSMK